MASDAAVDWAADVLPIFGTWKHPTPKVTTAEATSTPFSYFAIVNPKPVTHFIFSNIAIVNNSCRLR